MCNNTLVETDIDLFFDLVGLFGGIIFTICNIPQIIKIIKTNSSKDISFASLLFYLVGSILVCVYGIYFKLLAIYVPCVIEILFEILLIILKCIYDKRSKKNKIEDVKDIPVI